MTRASNMTKEEAARVLKAQADYYGKLFASMVTAGDYSELWELEKRMEALEMGADALRGPQPDPDTGLVRCGCGGKAEIRKWEWANDTYIAGCTVCDANVDFPYDIDETDKIISDWNRAMGRRTEK